MILLVDDDQQICDMLKIHIEEAGFECEAVHNGVEAIEMLRKNEYQLMITDIVMPTKEGISTIVESRRSFPNTPVIAISGGGQVDAEEYLTAARMMGASATLKKPFHPSDLIELLKDML